MNCVTLTAHVVKAMLHVHYHLYYTAGKYNRTWHVLCYNCSSYSGIKWCIQWSKRSHADQVIEGSHAERSHASIEECAYIGG